jgi:hypothetical protein
MSVLFQFPTAFLTTFWDKNHMRVTQAEENCQENSVNSGGKDIPIIKQPGVFTSVCFPAPGKSVRQHWPLVLKSGSGLFSIPHSKTSLQ